MAKGNGKASATVSQAEINGILWKACETFRGAVDPSEYKNYISDVWQDHYDKLVEEYGEPTGLFEYQVKLPSLPEQRAIADILEVAEREVLNMVLKLDALKRQKKGLMQQLLAGKVRVSSTQEESQYATS